MSALTEITTEQNTALLESLDFLKGATEWRLRLWDKVRVVAEERSSGWFVWREIRVAGYWESDTKEVRVSSEKELKEAIEKFKVL